MEVNEVDIEEDLGYSHVSEHKQSQPEMTDCNTEIQKKASSEAEKAAVITAQAKLADSERKLADEMKARKEKRILFKGIIDEEENQLKVLTKQIQSVQDAISLKELKIREMKRQRREMPFLKKFGMQINISKSVLRKERLEDDLSVLKSRSAARRRKIQKYKTRIRYDLQILSDPCTTTSVDSPRVTKPKAQTSRPIPACFFVSEPSPYSSKPEQVACNVAEILEPKVQMKHTSILDSAQAGVAPNCTGNVKTNVVPQKCVGSKWTLNSIDTEEISSLLTKQLLVQENEELSKQLARSSSSENVQGPLKLCIEKELSTSIVISSSSISLDVSTID